MLESKVLVLKSICLDNASPYQKLNGIVRIEKDDSFCSLRLSLVNAYTDKGEFVCAIVDSAKKPVFFSLGARPSSLNRVLEPSPNLSNGFAVGIAVVKDNIPQTVAFSCEKKFCFTLTDMNKAFAERSLTKRRQEQVLECKPNPVPIDEQKEIIYNDEAVATENYYDIEYSSLFDGVKGGKKGNVSSENDELDFYCKDKAQKGQANDCRPKAQTSAFYGENPREPFFYQSVKRELDQLFDKFPTESSLASYFGESNFVRVYYSEEKYYVVGLIKEKGEPKYICYGVPGTYSPDPPKELKGYCSFIPLSIFDLFGQGFWMMFQSAKDGKCIKRS